MSEIKWAYDEKTGSFSALPASNFLLVALAFIGILPFVESVWWAYKKRPRPCPNVDMALWEKYSKRYKVLFTKQMNDEKLTWQEQLEWEKIRHPPWAEPGEKWAYPID